LREKSSRSFLWAKLLWLPVAGAILFFLLRSLLANWAKVELSPQDVRWGWLALSGLVFMAGYFVSALVWHLSLAVFETSPGIIKSLEITVLSQLPKYLPGGIWAVVGQIELTGRSGVRRSVAAAAAGLMSAGLVLSGLVFGLATAISTSVLARGQLAAAAAVVVAAGVLVHPAVFSRAVKLSFRLFRRQAPQMSLKTADTARLLAAAVLYWPVAGLGLYLMAAALTPLRPGDIPVFVGAYALSWTIGYVAVFAPGGIGVREGILVLLLSGVTGLPAAVLISLVQRVWLTLIELLFAGGWLAFGAAMRARDRRRKRRERV